MSVSGFQSHCLSFEEASRRSGFYPEEDPRRSGSERNSGHSDARGPRGTHPFTPPRIVTMADPAIQELKRNAMILGAWIATIRIAPYVCHAVQGALSK